MRRLRMPDRGVQLGITRLPRADAGFFVVEARNDSRALADQVVAKYGRGKTGPLTRKDIGLERTTFDRLDSNHDGQLDADQLSRFATGVADVELVIRIGQVAVIEEQADLRHGHEGASFACAVQAGANGTLVMTTKDAQIGVQARPEPETDTLKVQAGFARQFFLQQFKAADVENKGYLEQRKLKGPQSRFLQNLFPLADRDGDGKLTERELIAFLDLQEHAP